MNQFNDNPIAFHSEGISFELKNPEFISKWLSEVARLEGKEIQELSYIFCSDDYLYEMNVTYLQHDTLTDVITFEYDTDSVHGDVFISVDRTADNAEKFNVKPENELSRVMVHGLLHLLGYKDKSDSEAALMREKENHYLELLAKLY